MTITFNSTETIIYFIGFLLFLMLILYLFVRVTINSNRFLADELKNDIEENNKLLKINMQDVTLSALDYAVNRNDGFKNLIKNIQKVNDNVKLLYSKIEETETQIKKLENDLIPQIQLLTNKTIEQEKYIKRLKRKLNER